MKPHWSALIDEESLVAVMPEGAALFARPVREALVVFLSGLPANQQAEILTRQAALPAACSFPERLAELARCSPVLQKLGQVLAREQRLPVALRQALQTLESVTPTVPLAEIERALRTELGTLADHGIQLRPPAIAEASVAVVIPFEWSGSATREQPRAGVFKVLKPNIEARLEAELALLETVGQHLDERCEDSGIPALGYERVFTQVHEKLIEEIQLRHEQRHLVQARRCYAKDPRVLIPEVFPFCTERVTAMERVFGSKVTEHGQTGRGADRKIARMLVESLIAEPLFSGNVSALFHGDPHAGNIFFTDDGRLALLDWSLCGRLDDDCRIAVVQMVLAGITLDVSRLERQLRRISAADGSTHPDLRQVAAAAVAEVRRGTMPGLQWLVRLLDAAVQQAGMKVSADLMLFRKSLLMVQGVCAEVAPGADDFGFTLVMEFIRHFAAEWPARLCCPPYSRRFATRLSAFDIAETLMSGPLTAGRFWQGVAASSLRMVAERIRRSALQEPAAENL